METPYRILDLKGLPEHQKMADFGDSLILHDSFDKEIEWSNRGTTDFMNSPIKVSSTMLIFFCLDGEVQLRQNIQEYVMRKNDVVFVYNGMFGEVIHMSRDMKFALVVMNEDFYYPMFNGYDMSAILKTIMTNPICTLPEFRMKECINLYTMMRETHQLQERHDATRNHQWISTISHF